MKTLFDLVELATEASNKENDAQGLFEMLKDNEKALKRICEAIYNAKADFEHIKKFF